MGSRAPESLPWTARVYARLPGSPFYVGLAIGVTMLTVLVVSEWLMGRFELMPGPGAPDDLTSDFRVAAVHCLMVAFAPSAYVALIQRTRRTWIAMQGAFGLTEHDLDEALRRVGRRPRWLVALVVSLALALSITVVFWTTPGDPTDLSVLIPEVVWHRVFTPVVILYSLWIGWQIVQGSWRLSQASRRIGSLDLLDGEALAPLKSLALMHSLAVIGLAACASPLGVEAHLVRLTITIWIITAVLAGLGLVLPLLGVRSVIRAERERELAWCDAELRSARDALKSGVEPAGAGRFAEVSAYRSRIEQVSDWPLDAPSFVRFALYLLLPLGSWIGGALVERVVDTLAQ